MPFTRADLEKYLERSSLSDDARSYVLEATTGPSRNVGTTPYRTLVSDFASRKMGTSIATESRTGELAYAILLEYSNDVLAYYDQPPPVECIRKDAKGREGPRGYHPDFLVVRETSIEVIEIKPWEQAEKLAAHRPHEWLLEGQQARDLPAERAFSRMGLSHCVVCSDQVPRERISNLKLLLQARHSNCTVSDETYESILKHLDGTAVQTIAELASALELRDLTPILKLIDDGKVFADLNRTLLSDRESCLVSKNATLVAYMLDSSRADWKWDRNAQASDIPPYKQSEQALHKLELLKEGANSRSARRWRKAVREASSRGLSAFRAVLPKTFNSGNRASKRPVEILAFAEHIVRTYWASAMRPSVSTAYRQYRFSARERHPEFQPVSRPTFAGLVSKLKQEYARSRGGARMANAAASPTSIRDRAVKPMRPFECATCDHYLVDIQCVLTASRLGRQTDRPWLSVMRDVATGLVLATWLSFRAPSRMACAMLLRSCVRRFGRLPEEIIVDRGPDFKSVYFAAFLADRGVTLTLRPPGDPRYGSEAERFFGQYKEQWLTARPGNITCISNTRAVSSSHAPQANATLEVLELLRELEQYRAWHADWIPAAGSKSPSVLLEEGLAYSCSGTRHDFDDSFVIASSVDETRIKLDAQRGLKVGSRYFWNGALKDPSIRASRLAVRRDPEDCYRIYVQIDGRWITCHCTKAQHAASADPLVTLGQSILHFDATHAREIAREESDRALIAELRKADAAIGVAQREREPKVADAPDPFAEQDGADVEELAVSTWTRSIP